MPILYFFGSSFVKLSPAAATARNRLASGDWRVLLAKPRLLPSEVLPRVSKVRSLAPSTPLPRVPRLDSQLRIPRDSWPTLKKVDSEALFFRSLSFLSLRHPPLLPPPPPPASAAGTRGVDDLRYFSFCICIKLISFKLAFSLLHVLDQSVALAAKKAMDGRIPPPGYFHYSPSGVHSSPSPHHPMRHSAATSDRERYLAELLAERQKLGPFLQVLPFCYRLLNQEILRASAFVSNPSFTDHERIEHASPLRLTGYPLNGGPMDLEGRSGMYTEENEYLHRMGVLRASSPGWGGTPGLTKSLVKKVVRLDVPVDKYPSYNFVGRLLGPRGNSLKRVEVSTQCRVYIRGRGSVKDSIMEESLRDKPGYEHLNEPLHILLEAEFTADIIDARLNQAVATLEDLLKPVDESMDYYKKQQLRELAILNGTLREESPQMSPSASPFNSTGMKRAKTGL